MTDDEPNRGMASPSQAEIETRARELANGAGRESMNEYDLAQAQKEILGKGSASRPAGEVTPGESPLEHEEKLPG